ncbi:MAG: DNA-protecting protein DprA [Proteobacteria bacterium]|nr:DNA-protecting protein DprA [Pseudomonadota bacterium]
MHTQGSIDNARAWIALIRAGVAVSALRTLVDEAGSASAALGLPDARWRQAGEKGDALRRLRAGEPIPTADLAWLEHDTHHLLGWDDPDYPALLRRIASPSPVLFVEGDADLLWHPQVAVVGSRHATAGGTDNARDFARAFAQAGLVVTSGLAEGIDAAAHLAALDAQAPTIAVVATGTDITYPRHHARLAARIREHGAIVSEFLPGTPPSREHFPRRNRIIAGLALGTLVVEAADRSGALITARLACETGREVFAVPGSIHNPLARGCHRLIRQGAALVEDAREVVEALAPVAAELADALRARLQAPEFAPHIAASSDSPPFDPAPTADPDHSHVLAALGHDPVAIDTLVARTGLTVPQLSSMLLLMELQGRVAVEHGRYARR